MGLSLKGLRFIIIIICIKCFIPIRTFNFISFMNTLISVWFLSDGFKFSCWIRFKIYIIQMVMVVLECFPPLGFYFVIEEVQRFLYLHHHCRWDTKPSSSCFSCLRLPLKVPVMVSVASCWIDWGCSWKELLNFWSYKMSSWARCSLMKDI